MVREQISLREPSAYEDQQMTEPSSRPRVFVSSTILDFADLRSALYWWFREVGLEVDMSEHIDFQRRPEDGTFESCFAAIENCQYYVLLIGKRKGTEYRDGVSVTQAEYRKVTELAKAGRIKPVVFVRHDVEIALGERREYKRALASSGANVDLPASTPALDDPDFIEAFLSEIRNTELARKGPDPSGSMWTYSFRTFDELTTALRVNLNLYRSINRQVLLANLKWELEENIAVFCDKSAGGVPLPGAAWIERLRRTFPITKEDVSGSITIPLDQARSSLVFWVTGRVHPDRLHSSALREAVASGEFLEYHHGDGVLAPGEVYKAMRALLEAIHSYSFIHAALAGRDHQLAKIQAAVITKHEDVDIECIDLVWLYKAHDLTVDILRLSVALTAYAIAPTEPFRSPALAPVSPIAGMDDKLTEQNPTHSDVDNWVRDPFLRSWLTGEHTATMDETLQAIERYPIFKRAYDEDLKQLADELKRRADSEGADAAIAWIHSREQGGSW